MEEVFQNGNFKTEPNDNMTANETEKECFSFLSNHPSMAKRKIDTANRMFQQNWETEFLFTEFNGQPKCLICKKIITHMKKSNVSRHYKSCHEEIFSTYTGQSRLELIENLKQEHSIEPAPTPESKLLEQSAAASYAVALEIARAEGSHSDGELIKTCAIEMAKAFKNEIAVEAFKTVPLSPDVISKRITEINKHIDDKIRILFEKCRYFSLCINESTDVTDTSKLSIFVRTIDNKFSINEELLALVPLHSTANSVDVFNAVREELEKYGGFSKCSAILTDGGRSLVGEKAGFRSLLKKNGVTCPILHCVIHQEALCGKTLMLESTMKIVGKVVKLIKGGRRTLSQRKFQHFLKDVKAAYGDLCLHNDIRWMNAGDTLKRFFNLRNEILDFFKNAAKANTDDIQKKLKEIKFLSELAFLSDITCHLNGLNTKLQQQNQSISDFVGHVHGFRNQLKLYIGELEASELHHFPSCQEIVQQQDSNDEISFSEFRLPLLEMQKQFERRFEDVNLLQSDLHVLNNPKRCTIIDQRIEYRLELCNFQADPFVLSRHERGLDLFKLLSPDKYPKLINISLKLGSMFGTTYKCGSSFSHMKYK